ncbi:hypothetical protein GJ744_011665 [Endocarpon pusillum]|uniref:Uncharacterized protein n=1 Tax=Endocarpon pusillum TaxID=364733 RepID=A0A8H7AED1_9EURO|nr:hypothetical protein GJ744_011665 [Endocarpon pusillum]
MEFEKPATKPVLCGLPTPFHWRRRKYLCQWNRLYLLLFGLLLAAALFLSLPGFSHSLLSSAHKASCPTKEFGLAVSHFPTYDFSTLTGPMSRVPDSLDTFINYRYRNHTQCQISSLDLHTPFYPLCSSRADMLTAISGGGRIGKEAPFIPRGCDMRWFSTEDICEIFERFEKVIVVGDSMMRHVIGAMNVLLRKDLGYGAVTNWNFSPRERKECFCNQQFDVKECSLQGIYKTSDVETNDPDSLACGSGKIDLVIEMMLKFPLDPTEVERFKALLSPTKPPKPYAFIFGHGLWNDLDLQATVNWLDGINAHTLAVAPYLADKGAIWPRLFITPNAAGPLKPDQWIVTQGDKALQIFEESVREEARERGVEHLGTWNMSIQANKFDGVHLDLRGNLIKAMAAINWLSLI